jgi:hypothetical protein
VSLPKPEAGLVIRYSYLWRDEHERGREEGVKDRPCAIIVTLMTRDGTDEVLVVPITHSVPSDPSFGMEIPTAVKKRLGLDDARSWVVLTESNTFAWPGPDLRPIETPKGRSFTYGLLPPAFFVELRRRFVALERMRHSQRVPRFHPHFLNAANLSPT